MLERVGREGVLSLTGCLKGLSSQDLFTLSQLSDLMINLLQLVADLREWRRGGAVTSVVRRECCALILQQLDLRKQISQFLVIEGGRFRSGLRGASPHKRNHLGDVTSVVERNDSSYRRGI